MRHQGKSWVSYQTMAVVLVMVLVGAVGATLNWEWHNRKPAPQTAGTPRVVAESDGEELSGQVVRPTEFQGFAPRGGPLE